MDSMPMAVLNDSVDVAEDGTAARHTAVNLVLPMSSLR